MCSSLYSLLLSSSLSVFLQTAAFIPTPTSLTSRSVFSALLLNAPSTMKVFIDASFIWLFWFHIINFCLYFVGFILLVPIVKFLVISFLDQKLSSKWIFFLNASKKKCLLTTYSIICCFVWRFFLLSVLLTLSLFRQFYIGNIFLVDNPTQQVMTSDNCIQRDLYLRSETHSWYFAIAPFTDYKEYEELQWFRSF